MQPSPIPIETPANVDGWEWTLESALTAGGLVIGLLGAVATALIAWLALAQTRRANKLDLELRTRAARAEFARAVEAYLAKIPPRSRLPQDAELRAIGELRTAAAAAGDGASKIPGWLHTVDVRVERQVAAARKFPPLEGFGKHPSDEMVALATRIEIMSRINKWVRTGELDTSELFPGLENNHSGKP